MAPSAIDPISSDRDGQALEGLSDNIDAVNVLKAELKKEKDMLEKSKFDAEKDKTQFRQYEVIQVSRGDISSSLLVQGVWSFYS